MEASVILSGLEKTEVLMASYKVNTSQGKGWIFVSGSRFVYIFKKRCSTPWLQRRKELSRWWMTQLARSLAQTVKVTERDGTVHVLEAIQYVPEVHYNLIFIRMLDEEGCRTKCNQASSQLAKETG